jgi:mannosyl-glycoprotein endo-beta-N-acetylglucosaminidase/stage II sporulation protein P
MALNKSRLDFINKYKDDVIEATKGTGIYPSVKMAQMIIESADKNGVAGAGATFVKALNAFGIKANSSWLGKKLSFYTPKDGSPVNFFRVYPTVKDSIIDHTKFLQNNKRYTTAGVFNAKSPADQLIALQKSGYSESPIYAQQLAKIIHDYNLESLDEEQEKKKSSKKGLIIFSSITLVAIAGLVYYEKNK